MNNVKDDYKAARAAIGSILNLNVLHTDKPPAVACEVYLKQWRLLRQMRPDEIISPVCKAKPRKQRVHTSEEKRRVKQLFRRRTQEVTPCS